MYASKSRIRAMHLKEELTLIQRGNRTVPDHLHAVKALADVIALIDHPISDDDLTLYFLNGLGPDFRDIALPIRAREKSLAFEKLHDLLVGHESYLSCMETATKQLVVAANFTSKHPSFHGSNSGRRAQRFNVPSRSQGHSRTGNGQQRDQRRQNNVSGHNNSAQKRYQPKCQLCDQLGHTAKTCPQLQSTKISVNSTATSNSGENKWLIDSAASHNITGDLSNLSIHFEYYGTDEVVLVSHPPISLSSQPSSPPENSKTAVAATTAPPGNVSSLHPHGCSHIHETLGEINLRSYVLPSHPPLNVSLMHSSPQPSHDPAQIIESTQTPQTTNPPT
ncbi:hypothetical protein Pint_17312 [Pistacia integerrima]|uniref:Uncharacterized protein n=1 Tax=Pistacia integerrima TaxID=434235 RepID=A0ACC0YZ02_9ROSI|nr:hypothetical protein Pint_17312 [Pistacia integerrima]